MSELSLDLTLEPLDDPSPILLPRLLVEGEASEGTHAPSGTLHATAIKRIHKMDCTVYRASMVLEAGGDAIPVILKTNLLKPTRADDLAREARIYAKDAKILQTHAIPHFYGAFRGTVAGFPMTCLVLEDCGEPIGGYFSGIDRELAMEIMKRVLIFHDIGLRHNDLSEENILINSDGRTFLIDLEYAQPHVCQRTGDVVAGSKQPLRHEFGCAEAWEIARAMHLWTKDYVVLWGSCVPRSVVKTISPESLITMAPAWLRETDEQIAGLIEEAKVAGEQCRAFQFPA
ncbi:hypothetical protein PLICRDRAFT_34466 [Plicaturopsis crispa FD-325 SS-3]|nr:hypothetical protein PLICRDRAFT_34466 [Plicaturopsis crispa FD-325 SS-3]